MPPVDPARLMPLPSRASAGPANDPDRSWLDAIGDAFTVSAADSTGAAATELLDDRVALRDALEGLGHDRYKFSTVLSIFETAVNEARAGRLKGVDLIGSDPETTELLQAYDSFQRSGDAGGARAVMGLLMEGWEDRKLAGYRQKVQAAEMRSQNDNIVPALIGGIGGAFTDPVNIATLPLGGPGKTILGRAAGQFAVQGAVTVAQTPLIAHERKVQGRRDLSVDEAAQMVLFAALGGAAFQGAFDGLRLGVPTLFRRLPEPVKRRIAPKSMREADIVDAIVADVEARGDAATQGEQDAAQILAERREARKASLLGDNGASRELDEQLQAEAVDALLALPAPENPRAPDVPRDDPPAAGGAAVSPDAPRGPSGSGGGSPIDRYMAKAERAESGGDANAKNPKSSATGPHQFIESTWLSYFKRRYGDQGLSDEAILAKRTNRAISNQLMRDFTEDNAAFLRGQGEAVTEGNLYLVHFLGPGGAKKAMDADPDARAADVLPAGVIEVNGFLRNMSISDVIRWAHRKMGGQGVPPRAGARAQLGEGIEGAIGRNEAERFAIQDEIDRALMAEDDARARMLAPDPDDPVLAALDAEPVFVPDEAEFMAAPDAPDAPAVPIEGDGQAEVSALVNPLNDLVENSKVSLNDFAALARRLQATEDQVREALERLHGRGYLSETKKGAFRRPRRGRAYVDNDVLSEIAAKGGLNRDGLGKVSREANERAGEKLFKGHDLKNVGGLDRFIPGAGPLLRKEGMGLDEVGEFLWERGVFGGSDQAPRPTEAEVLDYLADISMRGEKTYFPDDMDAVDAEIAAQLEEENSLMRSAADYAARATLGRDLTEAEYRAATALLEDAGDVGAPVDYGARMDWMEERYASAILAGVEREVDDTLDLIYAETDDAELAIALSYEAQFAREAALAQEGRGGPDAFTGDAGEGAGRSGAGYSDPFEQGRQIAQLPDEERAPFLDPEGEAVKRQAESLEHDMRMAVEKAAEAEPAPMGDQVRAALTEYGFEARGDELSMRIDRFADEGTVSDGARIVTLRLDEQGRYLERLDGFGKVERDVDLRQFDDPQAAIEALLERPLPPRAADEPAQMDFAAPTQEQRRIALERQMKGRKKGTAAQRAPGSDGGLFDMRDTTGDAFAGETQFRLSDEGDPETPADMLAKLDDEQAEYDTIRSCLTPKKGT